jgi:hypothetical protein
VRALLHQHERLKRRLLARALLSLYELRWSRLADDAHP